MNKIIEIIITTTGAALIIIAVYKGITGEKFIYIHNIFEILGANILIVIGSILRQKFEIRNVILHYIVDVSYTIFVILIFGLIFNWYNDLPVWFLIAMILVIDIFVIIVVFNKMRKDTNEINELLKKRRGKNMINNETD